MNFLSDIITYVRRIVKTPSNAALSDNLIVDYINRFWIMDVDARIQLFDLKTTYSFETIPQVCDYNIPLYQLQSSGVQDSIAAYPVYQGFNSTASVNGIQIPVYVQRDSFWKGWPSYIQSLNPVAVASGGGPYSFRLPFFPAIPGHIDLTGIIYSSGTSTALDPIFATQVPNDTIIPTIPYTSIHPAVFITYQNEDGSTTTLTDSGVFLSTATGGDLTGILVYSTNAGTINPNPYGYQILGTTLTANATVNYITGQVNIAALPTTPVAGSNIQAQCYFYQPGIPRAILNYNNTLTLRPPPNIPYLIEIGAYLTPAAFLSTSQAIQFGYMCEYIARGAARKILADTGDIEQFQFYEPLFKEQETLVWKRSQRIFTSARTPTIYSDLMGQSPGNSGQGVT